ncbi:hypothetical protein BE08_09755 [Sorangium cellulosum]|uniref:Uncharacterized protein n=1 Tax=Sorangium cellulosum TaxID=56 RepID=A0A150PKR5_SORCE|nr:hypothetical protein BE08_09755 [Sorangium cellulosum]
MPLRVQPPPQSGKSSSKWTAAFHLSVALQYGSGKKIGLPKYASQMPSSVAAAVSAWRSVMLVPSGQ